MSRGERERLSDMLEALDRCTRFRPHLDDDRPFVAEMALHAILRNLAVVGEAARVLPEEVRSRFASIPWPSIAGLRNILVHEYFNIDSEIIRDIVDSEIRPLADAIRADLATEDEPEPSTSRPDDLPEPPIQ